jgi:hypothetical protein
MSCTIVIARNDAGSVTWLETARAYFRFLAFFFFAAFGADFAFLRFAIVPSKLEMALSKTCRRESTSTAIRLHQNARNSDST